MKPTKPILIYNQKTNRKVRKKVEQLEKVSFPGGVDLFESTTVESLGIKIEKIHSEKSHDLILIFGGDGTISSVVNCIVRIPEKDRIPILPLPAGTGNSLLRDFNIHSISDALTNFENTSAPGSWDVLKIEELNTGAVRYCINVIGMGFVTDLASYAVRLGKFLGTLSYFLGALSAIRRFKPYRTIITDHVEGKEYSYEKAYFLTVSNTMYTGGAIKIAPKAKYNDGLMDVVVIHDVTRLKFLTSYFDGITGKHINVKGVKYFKAKDITIESEPSYHLMPDGDLGGRSPIRITVCPGQVPFYLS